MNKSVFRDLLSKLSPSIKHTGQFYYLNQNFKIVEVGSDHIKAEIKEPDLYTVEIDTELKFAKCHCAEFKGLHECAHIATILIDLINRKKLPNTELLSASEDDWKTNIERIIREKNALVVENDLYTFLFQIHTVGDLLFIEFTKHFIKQSGELGREMKIEKNDPYQEECQNSEIERLFLQDLFLYAFQIDHFTFPKNKIRLKPIQFSNRLLDYFSQVRINWVNQALSFYPEKVEVTPLRIENSYKLQLLPESSPPFFAEKLVPLAEYPLAFSDGKWIYRTNMFNSVKSFDHLSKMTSSVTVPEKERELFETNFLAPELIKSNLKFPVEWLPNEVSVEPIPEIRLLEIDNHLLIELQFKYENFSYPFYDRSEFHLEHNPKVVKVARNHDKESEWIVLLRENHRLKYYEKKNLVPTCDIVEWIFEEIPKLEKQNISVLGEDLLRKYKISRSKGKLNIAFQTIDEWLQIDGKLDFGDDSIDFKNLLNSNVKKKKFIKLSGRHYEIKDEWLNQLLMLQGLADVGDEIRIHSFHINMIDELFSSFDFTQMELDTRKKVRSLQQSEIKPSIVPESIKADLRDYQKDGYSWLKHLYKNKIGGLLADDMGLGKTLQMICLLSSVHSKGTKKSLIVVPTSLIFNWLDEINKFNSELSACVLEGPTRKQIYKSSKASVFITTYGVIIRDIEWLQKEKFELIILDESQQIKNPSTKSFRSVKLLNAKVRYTLTGTPVENHLLDLWSQFSFITPGLLGNESFFNDNFAKEIATGMNPKRGELLKSIIKPFLLRRTKDKVLSELPPKTEMIIKCKMSEEQEDVYKKTRDSYHAVFTNQLKDFGIHKSRFKALEALTKLRQLTNHPKTVDSEYTGDSGKIKIMMQMLEEILDENHTVLIFSQFVKMLTVVKDEFHQRGIEYNYLDGSTRNRKAIVDEFQNENGASVFLISLKAGGVGLNLTKADYVFILDPWWNPAVEMQAVERVHRIGQNKSVFVYRFITENTVEEKVRELQEKKKILIDEVISDQQSTLAQMDENALMYLFE